MMPGGMNNMNIGGQPINPSAPPPDFANNPFLRSDAAKSFFANLSQMNPKSNSDSVKMSPDQLQNSMKGWVQVRLDEERSDELTATIMAMRIVRYWSSVQDAPPP